MSPDPYDALEGQLRQVVADRRVAEPGGSRRRHLGLLIALGGVVAGGSVAAAAILGGSSSSDRDVAIARGTFDTAERGACLTKVPARSAPIVVDVAPDQRYLNAYSVLRRAPAPGRRVADAPGPLAPGYTQIVRGSTREAVAADGARVRLTLVRGLRFAGPADPVACQRAVKVAALGHVSASDAALRTAVTAEMDRRIARAGQKTAADPQMLLVRFSSRRNSKIASATLLGPPRRGELNASAADRVERHRGVGRVLMGLVEDRVRAVRVVPVQRTKRSNQPITVAVRDNVYDIELPPGFGAARVEYLDAKRRVLNPKPASDKQPANGGGFPDPRGGPPWRVTAFTLGTGPGTRPYPGTCVTFRIAPKVANNPQAPGVCGLATTATHPNGWFFTVRRLTPGLNCSAAASDPLSGGRWCKHPARTALWGAFGTDVRSVRVLGGPDGPIEVRRISNGATLAVLPPIAPRRLRVQLTLTNGEVRTLVAEDTALIEPPKSR